MSKRVIYEKEYLGEIIPGETQSPPGYSREVIMVMDGAELEKGSVIGKQLFSVPETGIPGPVNAGDGTLINVVAGNSVKTGTYQIIMMEARSDNFAVMAPDGTALIDAKLGKPFTNPQINFTLEEGAAAFAEGDFFTVEVVEGSGECGPIDFSATDGRQKAHGVSIAEYDGTAGLVRGVAIVRAATRRSENLKWPKKATDEQIKKALAELDARGIIEKGA